MKTLMIITRLALIIGGACGVVVAAWAFIDPGAFAMALDSAPLTPPSPRWRAAVVFLFSLLALGFGTGVLRHRKLP